MRKRYRYILTRPVTTPSGRTVDYVVDVIESKRKLSEAGVRANFHYRAEQHSASRNVNNPCTSEDARTLPIKAESFIPDGVH